MEKSLGDHGERVKFGIDFLDFFSDRHASTHAAFFIEYLTSGMSILDCGCGPGSITIDLARLVSPGQAIGIDIESAHIEKARMLQQAQKVGNVEFRVGDINQLPFNDNTFDAVFAQAFREIRRVMKSGGVFGARHCDWGGIAYLRKAGFSRTISSASYDCWTPNPETARKVGNLMKAYFESDEFVVPVMRNNMVDGITLEKIQCAFDDCKIYLPRKLGAKQFHGNSDPGNERKYLR